MLDTCSNSALFCSLFSRFTLAVMDRWTSKAMSEKHVFFWGVKLWLKHGGKWDKTMRHADFWGLKWIQLEHYSTMKTSDTQTIRNICFNDTQAMNDGFGCGLANVCQFHGSVNRGNDLTWYIVIIEWIWDFLLIKQIQTFAGLAPPSDLWNFNDMP